MDKFILTPEGISGCQKCINQLFLGKETKEILDASLEPGTNNRLFMMKPRGTSDQGWKED